MSVFVRPSTGVFSSQVPSVRRAASPASTGTPPAVSQLASVAREFEGVLLRQLLTSCKVAGPKSDEGHGTTAIAALADGIEAAGGLGLAKSLESTLLRTSRVPAHAPTRPENDLPQVSDESSVPTP